MQGSTLELPTGYYLERDPDVLILRRLDGSMVGAFSARGAAPEAVLEAIEETAPRAPRSALRARFFGHFEMFCNDEVVTLGRNGKALAILKYLLAHRVRPVSQDHLMGWLWPESNLKKARWSLNSAIHVLRKLLSDCPSSGAENYVLLEEGYYRLCPTVRVETDVDEFDAHYERGRCLDRAHRRQEAAAEYERAVELYRGDYLIEDLYEAGQPQESIRACYRLLEKDRCHEDSYRLLMQCYASLGLRGRALRHYRLCKEVLEQEYGTTPSSETRSLYSSLLGYESA
jgi:LuxR family maltose regulon positive regulatory protein